MQAGYLQSPGELRRHRDQHRTLGEHAIAHIDIASGEAQVAKLDNETGAAEGSRIGVGFDSSRALLFDADGKALAAPVAVAA